MLTDNFSSAKILVDKKGHARMLFPELEKLISNGTVTVEDEFWVTDFRHDDILNKPIRNITPTLVKLFDNSNLPAGKKVYYANYHFKPVSKSGKVLATVIAPYDNTGFRGFTGVSVNIFFTKKEAQDFFTQQCDTVKEQIFTAKEMWEKRFNDMLSDIETKIISL